MASVAVMVAGVSGSAVADYDADGVPDDVDNCTHVPNPSQADQDSDTIGNACDPDLNNDCLVDQADLDICFPLVGGSNPSCDFDEDGQVTGGDIGILGSYAGGPPGPSASGVCDPAPVPSLNPLPLTLLVAAIVLAGLVAPLLRRPRSPHA